MGAFRVLLAAIFVMLAGYTAVVGGNHGWDLLSVFFGDIVKMEWPGQFNLDFTFMLMLSGLWVAWRHGFTPVGLLLGFLAFNGGALFLSAYLLVLTGQAKGNMREVLLGMARA
jgi:hypothetical protein